MKFRGPKLLTVAFLATGLFLQSPEVHASKKMTQVVRSRDIDRAISANQSLLHRFQKEREELLKSRPKSGEDHLFANRLKVLNSKIEFLQREVARSKARPVPPPAAPAAAKAAPHKTSVAPLRFKWKGLQSLEPRKRIFLAWKRNVVPFK